MSLRIAYVINSLEGGGAALPVPSITDVLRRHGAEIRVLALTRRDGRALPSMLDAGLNVVIRDGGEKDHLAALAWLNDQARAWRPTHIWTSLTRATLLGQLVGQRLRTPVISWQHSAYLKPANKILLRARRRRSRLWIGDSEVVTKLTAERLGVESDRLMKWPIFRADPAARLSRPWRPGETLRIGSLGRLHPKKGYDVLVEALALLPQSGVPCEVVIGGAGEQDDALKAMAQARGVRTVRFAGYVDDPGAFLAGLHLYIQPSRAEGLCIAAHEAMQAGLPVVASAVGELTYSIEDGVTGRTVPPGDAASMAEALGGLLERPERLAAMGAAARERVLDHFGPDRFEAAGVAVLERLKAL